MEKQNKFLGLTFYYNVYILFYYTMYKYNTLITINIQKYIIY